LTILVVERERHAREGLKAILSADGHDVKVAEDMWAGFASIFSRPYDLLLLDDNVQAERHVSLNVLDLLRFAPPLRARHPRGRHHELRRACARLLDGGRRGGRPAEAARAFPAPRSAGPASSLTRLDLVIPPAVPLTPDSSPG
jgi:CheY-like chemotaxis protein